MKTNKELVASLLAHANAQSATAGNWQAIVDRLDSLRFAVRQAERAGRPVPSLAAVDAAVRAKVGHADTAVAELDAVLRVLENG